MNYYNENNPAAATWLRGLIDESLIPPGYVDTRSIAEVSPADLGGFIQCHFFAGITGWSFALSLVGWPADRPCWTGSCPCQPFSVANVAHGGGKGDSDPRHLAPVFQNLISKCLPPVIFGEQVAAAIGWGWLDELFLALEDNAYACAAAVLPAYALGAPHQRKRLFWAAYADGEGLPGPEQNNGVSLSKSPSQPITGDCFAEQRVALDCNSGRLLRRDGIPLKMARSSLHGFGNAIVPQVAAVFIRAFMEATGRLEAGN